MQNFLRLHYPTLLIFLAWLLVGSFSIPAAYILISLTILAYWRNNRFFEIFLGFIFITILSDHLGPATDFAKTYKNIYMVVLAAIPILSRKDFRPFNRLYLYFIPFLLIGLIVTYRSPQPVLSIQKLVSYGFLLFAIPQFLNWSFRRFGAQALKDLVFFGITLIVAGLVMIIPYPDVTTSHGGRFRAMFGNPNGLGIYLTLLLMLFLLCREYFKDLITKGNLRFVALILIVAILLSGSRTAVIGSILFLVLLRFYRISPLLGFIVFASGVLIGEVVVNNISDVLYQLGLAEYFRVETLDEASGRFVAWQFAWEHIQSNFWFGRGFAYDEWLMTRNQEYLNMLGHQGGVHNTYLIFWLNTGLIGLLLFLRGFILLFLKGAKNSTYALPIMWLILFSTMLEPWLAASLNPYTTVFLVIITILTDPLYQSGTPAKTTNFDPAVKSLNLV